jgi:hypothetical protein
MQGKNRENFSPLRGEVVTPRLVLGNKDGGQVPLLLSMRIEKVELHE